MRLQKENLDEVAEDSAEYKSAVKSVIRCQIQSLLQKLALETGEESIVISTNVSAGTYAHLGSCLGREYLEDGDEFIKTICMRFTDFCADAISNSQVFHADPILSNTTQEEFTKKPRKTLPFPKSVPRKRPSTPTDSPPNKRKADNTYPGSNGLDYVSSQSADDENLYGTSGTSQENYSYSSHFIKDNSSQIYDSGSSQKDDNAETEKRGFIWIKSEPEDKEYEGLAINGFQPCDNIEKSVTCITSTEDFSDTSNSIINRPRSLIPLANICKRYGTNRSVKMDEASIQLGTDHGNKHPSDTSILRSLYEQPLYALDSFASNHSCGGSIPSINLPSTLTDGGDQFPSTENPVLSGYYDSDMYPKYRHYKKHSGNAQKKSRYKEKCSSMTSASVMSDSINTSPTSSELRLKVFESGGRLVYACDVCKRELSHLTSYRRHMKLHTMERPHKCPVCDKGFIRKYHCIDHLNKHHKEVTFDPETLTLTEESKHLAFSETVFSESISISPEEYNYTLDQSLESMSDIDRSMTLKVNVNQSASSMLSELAKSAAKQAQMLSHPESEIKGTTSQSEEQEVDEERSVTQSMEHDHFDEDKSEIYHDEYCSSNKSSSTGLQSTEGSPEILKPDLEAMTRKCGVAEGIKAIVAHLKSSSKKKKMISEIDPLAQQSRSGADDDL